MYLSKYISSISFQFPSRLGFILMLLITSSISYSQSLNLDSLQQVWENESLPDTIRLDALYDIVKVAHQSGQADTGAYYAKIHYDFAEKRGLKKQMSRILNRQGIYRSNTGNYEGAIDFYNRSLKISNEIDYKKGIASSNNNIGRVHEKLGNYAKAKSYFLSCLDLFEELDNQRGSLITMNNIATIYLHQGDYKVAIDYYTSSLKIAEQLDASDIILNLLNNIGLVYKRQGDNTRAIEYYTRSLETSRKINNKVGEALTLNNIGVIYEDEGDYEMAKDYYNRSLIISEEIGDKERIVSCLINIGSISVASKDYLQAIDYQNRALHLAEDIGYKRGVAVCLSHLGSTQQLIGNMTQSINYSLRALTVSRELGLVEEIKSSADNLYRVYEKTGNHRASLEMYKLFISMRDSIENIEVQKEIVRQEIEYNYQKQSLADSVSFAKQKELDNLLHQSQLDKERYGLLGAFAIILVFIVVYLRIKFIKRLFERETLLNEIRILKAGQNIDLTKSISENGKSQLDKDKIETAINNPLNQSDWNILNALYHNPAIGNKEIADVVSLSIEGVRSSLKKMYSFFYIEKTANQRVVLVIEAAKLSNPILDRE